MTPQLLYTMEAIVPSLLEAAPRVLLTDHAFHAIILLSTAVVALYIKATFTLIDSAYRKWGYCPPIPATLVVRVATHLVKGYAAQGLLTGAAVIDSILTKTAIPTPPSFGVPMMAMATVEHRPRIVVHQEQGSDSDDDDGEGDNHVEQNVERDGAHHGAESSWDRVLRKYAELDSRLRALEEAADLDSTPNQS